MLSITSVGKVLLGTAFMQASRLGLAGGAFGRPKSLREGTAGLGGATASQQSLPAQDRSGSELDAVRAPWHACMHACMQQP